MTQRRRRPITTQQSLLGSAAIVLAVAGIVALSNLLLLPAMELPPLEAPELEEDESRRPGEVSCPAGEEVKDRGSPIPVTSFELIECPQLFDGETVSYEGEAVGAVLLRQEHAWVHLNDDPYGLQIGPLSRHRTAVGGNSGMAVSVPRQAAVGVKVGGYRRQGTGLAVVGIYRRAADIDGGAPAIQAQEVRVVREAETFAHPVAGARVIAAVALSLLAAVLGLINFRNRRREHSV